MEMEANDYLTDEHLERIKSSLQKRSALYFAEAVYSIENIMNCIKNLLLQSANPTVDEELSKALPMTPVKVELNENNATSKEVPEEPLETALTTIPPKESQTADKKKANLENKSKNLLQKNGESSSVSAKSEDDEKQAEKKRSRKHTPKQADIHSKPLLTCEHCGYQTSRKDHFNRHLTSHSKDKPYKCDKCSFSCGDKWHLQRHLRSTRVHTAPSGDPKGTTYECETCNYKTDKLARMERHKRTHSGEKPFSCQYCNYSAAQKSTLARHLLTHTGEKPFKCMQCEYSAADTKSLKFHTLQKHGSTDGVQHSCPHCDYVTPVYRYYQLHLRAHSDARPYLCHICGYSAKRPHGLTKHYRSMHGYPKRPKPVQVNSENQTNETTNEASDSLNSSSLSHTDQTVDNSAASTQGRLPNLLSHDQSNQPDLSDLYIPNNTNNQAVFYDETATNPYQSGNHNLDSMSQMYS